MSENRQNYLNFEYYCINKHLNDFHHITYHWSIIPDIVLIESGYFKSENELRLKRKKNNQILKEYGLDGISIEFKDYEKIYHGLQMKLWKNTICANDLGTFISVIFNRFGNNSKGYLYHTSKLEKTLKNDVINGNKIIDIKINNLFMNNLNNISLIKLRPYQIEAIKKLNEKWSNIKLLYLPCGTGKTLIFCEYLKENNFKNIIIFSPLTMLTEQNLDNIKNYLPSYNHILVDVNGTRDFNVIKENLNKYTVFSSTFKSAEGVISKIFNPEEGCVLSEDTILIVDEAHNLLNLDSLVNLVQKFNKVLLVTATPPTQMDEIIPNNIIYKYSFSDAIKDGYICDYIIYLPFIENNKVIIEQPEELLELDEDICKKCLFLINGLLRTGCRRTIVYLKCKNECELYQYVLNYIMNNYHYYEINIKKIINETNKKDRIDTLSWFEENNINEELRIILSIRILDEGINLIKCDSIYLTNLGDSSNDVRTVQRFLRANRKDPNNISKKAHIFIWCEDTNICLNAFQMLKNNDIDFNKKIKIMDNNYGTYYKDNNNNLTNIDKYDINNEIIQNINIKCLTVEELWKFKKNLLFEYCDVYKNIPLENIIYKNQKIGCWYKSQKNKIKINLFNNTIIFSDHLCINKELIFENQISKENTFIYNEFIQNIYIKDDLLRYTDNKIVKTISIIEQENIINDVLSFIDFLKKYSNVPNQFIDDFFSLIDYKEYESSEKIVDLDKVVKWLDINKGMAKKTLIKSYRKNIDYIIKKVVKPKGSGGHNAEIILLTIRCFKKFCQLTRSKHGDDVRNYFIDVEYTLNKYKNYIIEGLSDKIDTIKKGKKPKVNPEKAIIYIFKTANSPENSLYKIGRTKDLTKRLQSHQSSLSEDIEILFYLETDDAKVVESCIKNFAKKYQYRKYKEVYEVNIDILKLLAAQCEKIKLDMEDKQKLIEMEEDKSKKYYVNISKK
jgi:superfamily II DNA or RNA helicase/phage anti-repressor protein